ncbi:MAG: hypothetical protein LUB59_07290 [Candidatus Gastranaerophilales bacterium]|nr:hypothetical protein [Candidatus Gastranaerophilales bacterium]
MEFGNMQSVKEILSMLNESDKNEIENMLVNIGTPAVPELVEQLQVVRGLTRGVVAMTLIRIGDSSIDYLKKAAQNNREFEWVAQYLITEIKGSKAA